MKIRECCMLNVPSQKVSQFYFSEKCEIVSKYNMLEEYLNKYMQPKSVISLLKLYQKLLRKSFLKQKYKIMDKYKVPEEYENKYFHALIPNK